MNIEVTGEHVNEQAEWLDALNRVGRFSVQYSHIFIRRLVVSAGPSVNVLVSDWRDPGTGAYQSALPAIEALFVEENAGNLMRAWVGYRVGLGVRF